MHVISPRPMALCLSLFVMSGCTHYGRPTPKDYHPKMSSQPQMVIQDIVMPLPNARIDYAGNVYILAMGANVDNLQLTNRDADNFAYVMQNLFDVPQNQVRLIHNTRRQDAFDGMSWLQELVQPGDLVLFFFSGHGTFIKDQNGDEKDKWDEALVMYEANYLQGEEPETYTIRDDAIATWIDTLPTSRVVLFLDSCFSASAVRVGSLEPKFFLDRPFWENQNTTPPPGAVDEISKGLVFAAAQGDQRAWESKDEGGLFTMEFLRTLIQAPQDSTFLSIFNAVVPRVWKRSKQLQQPTHVGNPEIATLLKLR